MCLLVEIRFTFTINILDCYIINEPIDNNTHGYQLAEAFTYEIWVYLTFIILPILYSITFCYTKCKINKVGVFFNIIKKRVRIQWFLWTSVDRIIAKLENHFIICMLNYIIYDCLC